MTSPLTRYGPFWRSTADNQFASESGNISSKVIESRSKLALPLCELIRSRHSLSRVSIGNSYQMAIYEWELVKALSALCGLVPVARDTIEVGNSIH